MRTSSSVRSALLVIAAYAAIGVGMITATAQIVSEHPGFFQNVTAMLAQVSPFTMPMQGEQQPVMPPISQPSTGMPLSGMPSGSNMGMPMPTNMGIPSMTMPGAMPDQTGQLPPFAPALPSSAIPMHGAPGIDTPFTPSQSETSYVDQAVKLLEAASANASNGTMRSLACFDYAGNAFVPQQGNDQSCDPNQGKHFRPAQQSNVSESEVQARIAQKFSTESQSDGPNLTTIISQLMGKLQQIPSIKSAQDVVEWLKSLPSPGLGEERSQARNIIQRVTPFHGVSVQQEQTQHGVAPQHQGGVPPMHQAPGMQPSMNGQQAVPPLMPQGTGMPMQQFMPQGMDVLDMEGMPTLPQMFPGFGDINGMPNNQGSTGIPSDSSQWMGTPLMQPMNGY